MAHCQVGGGAVSRELMTSCAARLAAPRAASRGASGRSVRPVVGRRETYTLSRRDVVGWKVMPYGPYLADASAAANGDAAANASRDMAVPPTSRIESYVWSETASRHADSSADWRFAADGFVRTRTSSASRARRGTLRVWAAAETTCAYRWWIKHLASFGCCPAESSAEEDKALAKATTKEEAKELEA